MPQSTLLEDQIAETNRVMWAVEPLKATMDLKPLLTELYQYAKCFNVGELCRDMGVNRKQLYRLLVRGGDLRVSSLLRVLYYMGLRLRLERDPIPRRLNYGSDHATYESKVDAVGTWQL